MHDSITVYIYMNLLGTVFFVCNHLDLHTGMGLENDDSCDKGISSVEFTGTSISDDDEEELWPDVSERDFGTDFNQEYERQEEIESTVSTFTRWMLLYLLLWAATYGISANALHSLIGFIHYVLQQLSPYAPFLTAVATVFPTSLHMVRKYFKLEEDSFMKFVVCPSCDSLYA